MRTYKIIIASAILAAGLSSCVNVTDESASAVIDDLKKELSDVKKSHDKLKGDYRQVNEELTMILEEMSTVSTKTASLQMDVETGNARLTQADQISAKISDVKSRLRQAASEALARVNAKIAAQ